jgi:hypothetical protein
MGYINTSTMMSGQSIWYSRWLLAYTVWTYSKDTPDKETVHFLVGAEQAGTKFHHNIQNDAQFKIYELFVEFSI